MRILKALVTLIFIPVFVIVVISFSAIESLGSLFRRILDDTE